jgi:hypothetical protein
METKNKVKIKTKASVVKRLIKKNIKVNEKIKFDDEGNVIGQLEFYLLLMKI